MPCSKVACQLPAEQIEFAMPWHVLTDSFCKQLDPKFTDTEDAFMAWTILDRNFLYPVKCDILEFLGVTDPPPPNAISGGEPVRITRYHYVLQKCLQTAWFAHIRDMEAYHGVMIGNVPALRSAAYFWLSFLRMPKEDWSHVVSQLNVVLR